LLRYKRGSSGYVAPLNVATTAALPTPP
jgi:hypothetical protein